MLDIGTPITFELHANMRGRNDPGLAAKKVVPQSCMTPPNSRSRASSSSISAHAAAAASSSVMRSTRASAFPPSTPGVRQLCLVCESHPLTHAWQGCNHPSLCATCAPWFGSQLKYKTCPVLDCSASSKSTSPLSCRAITTEKLLDEQENRKRTGTLLDRSTLSLKTSFA